MRPGDAPPAHRGDAGGARRHRRPDRRQPGQPDRHRPAPRRAGRAGVLLRGRRDPARQRRDLPRHLLRRCPGDVERVGDLARGDRRQLLLQVLLDDRLAAGLAARPGAAAPRGGPPDRQLHDLPARARPARRRRRLHPGGLRGGRRARRPVRGQPRPAARRTGPARHRPARPRRRRLLRLRRRRPPHRRLHDLDLPPARRDRGRARAGRRLRPGERAPLGAVLVRGRGRRRPRCAGPAGEAGCPQGISLRRWRTSRGSPPGTPRSTGR